MDYFGEDLRQIITEGVTECIGCNRCMDACPVTKDDNLTIADLNYYTISDENPPKEVLEFTLNCVQCSRCVPVCPPAARRDLMVLYTKSKIKSYPKEYERYVSLKRPNLSGFKKGIYKLMTLTHRGNMGKLYDKLDTENLREAELLFYPGCYIFDEVCIKTLALMDFLKEDYEVLGGYTTCCGWPQFLQGRINMANELMENLYRLIQKVKPKRIITTCAECFAALRKLKAKHKADFIPLTTTDWLFQNINKFPIEKSDKILTLHDSCHLSRKFRKYEVPRKILDKFGNFKEMENFRDLTKCCYYYNFKYDKNNIKFREERLKEAEKVGADVFVTDCITCLEVYEKIFETKDIKITEINDLFYNLIKK